MATLSPDSVPPDLHRELAEDIVNWRAGIYVAFGRLAEDPGALDPERARRSIDQGLAQIEARADSLMAEHGEETLPDEACKKFYLDFGAYRRASEALVELVARLAVVNWARLRKPRI